MSQKESKTVRIPHTPIICTPREGAARRMKSKMAQEGWHCISDREREGLFGVGAHIELKFERYLDGNGWW